MGILSKSSKKNALDSELFKGNQALRLGRYSEAIEFFEKAARRTPALKPAIDFNIALAVARMEGNLLPVCRVTQVSAHSSEDKIPLTALIVGFSHLPRPYMLAERFDGLFQHVVLAGFETNEKAGWNALGASQMPLVPLKAPEADGSLASLDSLAARFKPDIVISCGDCFPAVVLGAMIKQKHAVPFVVEESTDWIEFNSRQNLNSNQWFSYADEKLPYLNLHDQGAAERQLFSLISDVLNKTSNDDKNSLDPILPLIDSNKRQSPDADSGKDIVLFWKQNDTGLYGRRSDMVIKYLASRRDVRKVVVLDAPISELDLHALKEGHLLTQGKSIYIKTYQKVLGQFDSEKISFNAFIYKADSHPPDFHRQGTSGFFSHYAKFLGDVLGREGVDSEQAVFWFYPNNFLSKEIISRFKPRKVVVDVVDDHRTWPNVHKNNADRMTENYREILGKADLSFANCQPLIDSMSRYAPSIQLVPNGCEERPEVVEPADCPLFRELADFRGGVIGLIGNLESKVDIPLMEKLALTFPDALIVLVGSTHANPKVRELTRFPNVRMFGVVDYKYAHAIARKFSVGIVPHVKNSLTENMNPLKVFMYISNHIPVVSTNISNLPSCDAILKAATHEEFIQHCRSVLAGDFHGQDYEEFIQQNCWRERFSRHIDSLLSGW